MRAESLAKSIRMLKGILDGKTYVAVAQESGLSRSAVEQRVKALARDLQTVVGVEWVDEDEVPTVKGMRARKDHYLEALEHYRPQRVVNASKGSRALTGEDIEHAVAMTRQHSNCRNRDVALLLVLFATAAKPLEIARLVVSDYLTDDGSVREESVMRADAAINGKERPLFFASTKVVAAVDAYLEERVRRGQGTRKATKYRGLDPDSRLFLTGDGREMPSKSEPSATGSTTCAESSMTSTARPSPGPDSKVCRRFARGERLPKDLPREAAMSIRSGKCSGSRSGIRCRI